MHLPIALYALPGSLPRAARRPPALLRRLQRVLVQAVGVDTGWRDAGGGPARRRVPPRVWARHSAYLTCRGR